MVLIADPLGAGTASASLLREMFAFTAAEAGLAQALQNGVSVNDYAARQRLSLNTVYTHLRHIKEKTGCSRVTELVRRLNDARAALPAKHGR